MHVIARGQWQIVVSGRIDDGIHLRRLRLHDRSRTAYFHGLTRLPDFHRDINTGDLIQRQNKGWTGGHGETLLLYLERICAHRKLRDTIKTGVVRSGCVILAALGRRGSHSGSRHSRTAGIADRASDRSGYFLAPSAL